MGRRYIAVASEACYGATAASMLQYIDIVSESIGSDQGMLEVVTAGMREQRFRLPGPYGVGGSIDLIVNPDNMIRFFKWGLGGYSCTPSAEIYRHQFQPSQTLSSFTMEVSPAVQESGLYQVRTITGVIIPSFSLEAVARELLTATIDVFGRKEDRITGTYTAAPSFSTLRPFTFAEGGLAYGSSTICHAEAFRVTFDNDIPDDTYFLGSRFRGGPIEDGCDLEGYCDAEFFVQGITVSGDMDIAFTDWTWWDIFWGGTSAGPSNWLQDVSLTLTFIGTETTGSGVAGYTNYSMEIYLPKVYIDTTEASFDRRERIVQSLPFTAIYDEDVGYIARIRVVNKIPAI